MSVQIVLIIALSGLLVSYYITEYSHLTHTDRVISRVYSIVSKEIDNINTKVIIGTEDLQVLDPFYQFKHYSLKKGEGLLDHAHRGYDTVTYVLSGELAYEDFRNRSGILYPGDVQWISTGKGMVHAEVAHTDCEVLQFWIGLKDEYRLIEPYYQNLLNDDIVKAVGENVSVKVISGESMNKVSYTITRTNAYVLDIHFNTSGVLNTDIPAGLNALIYVIQGEIQIDDDRLKKNQAAVLSQWDTDLEIKSIKKSRVFLIAGEVLDELIVVFGQFYMPNYPLVEKASRDYKNGKDGFEGSVEWKSSYKN